MYGAGTQHGTVSLVRGSRLSKCSRDKDITRQLLKNTAVQQTAVTVTTADENASVISLI